MKAWIALLPLALCSLSAAAEPKTLLIERKTSGTQTVLQSAYQRLQQGDDAAAEQALRTLIQKDGPQPYALQALAALAQHRGSAQEARAWRQQAQQAAPLDADSRASILLYDQSAHPELESQLKFLAEQHPGSAISHWALGRHYASEKRWREAQQAFFAALNLLPAHPDLLYLIAICLEHLEQPKLAAAHYQQALAPQKTYWALFPRPLAEQRLQALQP